MNPFILSRKKLSITTVISITLIFSASILTFPEYNSLSLDIARISTMIAINIPIWMLITLHIRSENWYRSILWLYISLLSSIVFIDPIAYRFQRADIIILIFALTYTISLIGVITIILSGCNWKLKQAKRLIIIAISIHAMAWVLLTITGQLLDIFIFQAPLNL